MKLVRFQPYSLDALRKDIIAGCLVGVVAIPLGMAFAIASGVKPEYGLYTTIIAGIVVAIFGGSAYQIAGPTGAFVPILLGIVLSYGYENLLIAGFMAGAMLVLMGLFKLGALIRYIPRPVTIGFTAGIAVTIFSGQIASFLGLSGMKDEEYFIAKLHQLYIHLSSFSIYSVLTAGLSLAIILLIKRFAAKLPGALLGLIASSIVAALCFPDKLATIGSSYGAIAGSLPNIQLPHVTLEKLKDLIGPAFIIAMLGAIESLLSAVVADEMTGKKHNSNRELVGQGLANMAAPLFGGIPATGAIARTATNIKSGAVSPISAIVHSFIVLAVLLVLAPYAVHIPLASLAPVLMVVAWNMSEARAFVHILKSKTSDSLVLVIIFVLTVFVDLTTAVGVGLLLSMIIFVKQMSDLQIVSRVLPDHENKHHKVSSSVVQENHDCPQINMYTVEGPLFFGTAQSFEHKLLAGIHTQEKTVILRFAKVLYMDVTGAASLSSVVRSLKAKEITVLVTGIQPKVEAVLKKTGLYDEIEERSFFTHTGDAIDAALSQLELSVCRGCQHFAFKECRQLSQSSCNYSTNKGDHNEFRTAKV